MFSLLIVDDEPAIRTGMKNHIPWQRAGVTDIWDAPGGPQALEIFARRVPDVLLTDINMQGMSGLELIREVNARYPRTRVVVLTGYDDFEYARTCLRMEVVDFLLKPVEEADVLRIVEGIRRAVEREREDARLSPHRKRAEGTRAQASLARSMRQLAAGTLDARALSALCGAHGLDLGARVQACVLSPRGVTGDVMALSGLCMALFDARGEGLTFLSGDGRVAVLLFADRALDDADAAVAQLRTLWRAEYGGTLDSGVGEVAQALWAFAQSYDQALACLEGGPCPPGDLREQMLHARGDVAELLARFDAYAAELTARGTVRPRLRRTLFEAAASLYYAHVQDTGEAPDQRLGVLMGTLRDLDGEGSIRAVREFIARLAGDARRPDDLVDKAKRYIGENLSGEISVASVARHLYVTPSHLSRLFKSRAGEGCNEYIVRRRLEKAAALLSATGHRVGEIARMVGYRDTNYFSLAFKKHMGVSPVAYRAQGRGGM